LGEVHIINDAVFSKKLLPAVTNSEEFTEAKQILTGTLGFCTSVQYMNAFCPIL
jgi:hypothetical protein